MGLIKGRTPGGTASRGASVARFQYRPRTAEEVKQRANRQIGSRDSFFAGEVDFFTPKAGDNTVRILPPTWEDARHYGIDLWIHYSIGADESAYLCLDKMRGERCPLCEERSRASGAGEEELADALRPRGRVAVWVIDRSQEGKGPMVWNMPAGLDKDFSNLCVDKQTQEVYAVDNPEDGFDISFKREGMDQRTKYSAAQIARHSTPLSADPQVMQRWLDYAVVHPLPSILQYRDYETIRAAFAGQAPAQPRGEGGAGTTQRSTPTAPSTSSVGAAPATREQIPARRSASARGPTSPAPVTAPSPAPVPASKAKGDTPAPPTWEQIHQLGEDALVSLVEDFGLTPPDEGFAAEAALQDWICTQLNIAAPVASAGSKPSWKERLRQLSDK